MQRRIPQLDAIRGLAVLLVMMHNSVDKYPTLHLRRLFAEGWMGVDVFFVLSGFLITGILLDTRGSEAYFKTFYARRCLRIWPLYYCLLLFVFVVLPIVSPLAGAAFYEPRSAPRWSFPLFLQNFLVAVPAKATGPLGVTWSLAIEEQFYLLWPLVVRFSSRAQLRRAAIAVVCLSPLLRLYLMHHNVNIYSDLFCRLDGLMAGALLADTVRSDGFVAAKFIKPAWTALLLAAPLAIITEALQGRWLVHSFTAIAAAALIYVAVFSTNRWLQALMMNRVLIYTGTISYGLYLIHKLPFDAAETLRLGGRAELILPIGFAGSYLLAALSWHLLERPFLKLKPSFERRSRTVMAIADVAPSASA